MTPFRWVLLCIFFTFYLLFGGSIFMLIEQHHEIHQKEELHVLRQDIQEILFRLDHNFYYNGTSPDVLDALTSAKEGVINRISAVCGLDNLLEDTGKPEPSGLKWNFYNSVFFAFTVVTTIGYGHLSPSTNLSKSFMIFYALIGIPINGILLSGVGDYFSNKLVKVHQKSKQKHYRGKCTLVFEIIFYLIPGVVVFMIIPAGVFVLIENWTFLDSIYFSFVSLTTIGFGDYVAGMGDGHNIWLWLYKAFIIIWITFGLGYLIMILGFIAKGMKSKKVRGVLEKRLTGIKNTKEKLSKDIDYMRRIVNELYLMKLKPTYDLDESGNPIPSNNNGRSMSSSCVHFERRCSSLPRLPTGDDGDSPTNPSRGIRNLARRLSESDLPTINREAGFLNYTGRAYVTAEELLVTVVNALSGNVMQNVMDAVDELNQYEQQVTDENEHDGESQSFTTHDNDQNLDSESCYSADDRENEETTSPWELVAVSESDEEILIEDDHPTEKLECVVIHNVDEANKSGFMDKVSGAIRKISGTITPPETPSRKISRNESDKKRKISRGEYERSPSSVRAHHSHQLSNLNQNFNHPQYSPFTRRPSSIRFKNATPDPETNQPSARNPRKGSVDLRKISQESRISTKSNSSYKTIDEIISSARASRRESKANSIHNYPHLPTNANEDQVDATNGKVCLETASLAHLLQALDTVQDRLQKTSMASDASYSESNFSDGNSADLSTSFAPSSTTKPINSRSRRSNTPPDSVDRRRKNGVFQPGFSYVNFGFNPDDESVTSGSEGRRKSSSVRKQSLLAFDKKKEDEYHKTKSSSKNNDNKNSKNR